jgi:cobalt-zinc-cadmium efflux system protein
MHIWEITSGMYSLTAHIEAQIKYQDLQELIDRINRLLSEKFAIEHTTLQIEPIDKQS